MSNLTGVTNGTFTLEETKVHNQFYFFRNDHSVLGDVGTIPIEMFSRYLIHKVREGEINERYVGEIFYEISKDGKVLRLTVTDQTKPALHIVKREDGQVSQVPEVAEPNFFKRVFAKWFG